MSYQSDISAAMISNAGLSALIADRFSWDVADGNVARPYIVATTVSDDSPTTLDGERELCFPLIQLSVWARTKVECIEVVKAVRALEGAELPGSSNVSLSFDGEQSTYDQETKSFGAIIEYRAHAFTN